MARPAARKGDIVKHKGAPPSAILDGSPNVLINSLPAARMGDLSIHIKPVEPIVQGSGSVLFNGRNASRITDKSACSGEIISGSGNVLIGDGADGRACSMCPGGVAVGNPVNPLLGAKVQSGPEDIDFALPGPLPLVWQRHYSSYVGPAGATPGLLGIGWRLPFEMHLMLRDDRTELLDTKNRTITFETLGPGEQRHSKSEGFWLLRGGQLPVPAEPVLEPQTKTAIPTPVPAAWQDDPRWGHVPVKWKADPHYVMAATAERTVWLFAASDLTADSGTVWLLVSMVDVYGRTQFYERNLNQRKDLPRGQLLAIQDGLNRRYELSYTHLGLRKELRLSGVGLDIGAETPTPLVQYGYSSTGDLLTVTDRHGRITREFTYDHHRISAHRVLGGPWARYTYESDAPGARVIEHSIDEGLAYAFDYQPTQTVVTDSLQRRTVYAFTGEGGRKRLSKLTDALGGVTEYSHSLEGQLVQEVDALGRRRTYVRDDQGRMSKAYGPDGRASVMEWDAPSGQPRRITGPHGDTTTLAHDGYGRLLKTTDTLGQTTEYRYADPADPQQRPSAEYPRQIIDAKGGVKTLVWSDTGQMLRYTDCSGHSTDNRYDGWGDLVSVTNAKDETVRYQRNALGQVHCISYPDGTQAHYRHDGRGALVLATDANGTQIHYQRDAHGRVVKITVVAPQTGQEFAQQQVLRYVYDPAGQLIELINENGARTTFAYDLLDRQVQEVGFDGREQRYEYDAIGQLLRAHDIGHLNGQPQVLTTEYAYNQTGQLIERQVPAIVGQGSHPLFQAQYQRFEYVKGRLAKASTGDSALLWRHDELGRVEEEILEFGDFRHSVANRYDSLGHRTHSRYPFTGEIDYLSYGSGYVHQILVNREAHVDFERDALHRETLRTLLADAGTAGQAVTQRKAFDPMGRLIRSQLHGGAALPDVDPRTPAPTVGGLSRDYGYSPIGLMVSIKKPGLRETQFGYDPFHRLNYEREMQHFEQAPYNVILNPHPRPSRALASHSWQFDPAGNRVSDSGHRTQDNRIVFDGERRFEYDAWGNTRKIVYLAGQRQGLSILMLYDGLHQLRASQTYNPKAEPAHQTITVHYRYDALGRRVEKKRVRESPDAAGQARTQTLQRTCYGWDGDRLVTTQTPGQVVSTVYEPGSFVPLLRIDTEIDDEGAEGRKTQYHYHCNHLGTPIALIERLTGALVWQIELDPWGITRSLYNPHDIHQPIKMQGQQVDTETGLFYNRYRYYDPRAGRYTTQDPIGLDGGINLYKYPFNPLQWVDRLGLDETIYWNNSEGRSVKNGPTNGNWCGGDWSGAQVPSKHGGQMGTAPPTNDMDSCCRKHDFDWDKCEKQFPNDIVLQQKCKNKPNADFLTCMKPLDSDPRKWKNPPKSGTESSTKDYRETAEKLFAPDVNTGGYGVTPSGTDYVPRPGTD